MFFPFLKLVITTMLLAACILGACGRIERGSENIDPAFQSQFPEPLERGVHVRSNL